MPYLTVRTNQTLQAGARRTFLEEASRTVAELLGKPERYVMVDLEEDRAMMFAGSDAPLAFLALKSIGLPEAQTPKLSEGLCALVDRALAIAPDRIYIEFINADRHLWGWDGGTF